LQGEAGAQHSKELAELRTRSDASIEAIRNSHREELSHTSDTHQEALESATKPLEKKINNLTIEANAARDDLAKAKNTISTQATELKALQEQANDLKRSLEKAASSSPRTTPSAEIESLRNELREKKDDYSALQEVYTSMKENYEATINNHDLELKESAKARVEALETLKSKHEAEKAQFAEGNYPLSHLKFRISFLCLERASLLRRVEEERDRALSNLSSSRSPPVTPKHSRILSNGSRDNLERLHHANDARLTQLETEHKQTIAQLT
jgi:chromosome segregation ATPase